MKKIKIISICITLIMLINIFLPIVNYASDKMENHVNAAQGNMQKNEIGSNSENTIQNQNETGDSSQNTNKDQLETNNQTNTDDEKQDETIEENIRKRRTKQYRK